MKKAAQHGEKNMAGLYYRTHTTIVGLYYSAHTTIAGLYYSGPDPVSYDPLNLHCVTFCRVHSGQVYNHTSHAKLDPPPPPLHRELNK